MLRKMAHYTVVCRLFECNMRNKEECKGYYHG